MTFPRRYLVLIIIGGFALFFWSRAEDTELPPDTPLQSTEGTITEVVRKTERGTHDDGRRGTIRLTLLTLREHPANLEFSVRESATGLEAGGRVRIESYDDIAGDVQRATNYPTSRQRVGIDSLNLNGTDVYTAAEAAERASSTRWAYRIPSLVCWAIFLTWAALAVRKHLPAMRRALDEKLG